MIAEEMRTLPNKTDLPDTIPPDTQLPPDTQKDDREEVVWIVMEAIFQFVFGPPSSLPLPHLTTAGKSIFSIIQEGNLDELMAFLDQYPQRLNAPNEVTIIDPQTAPPTPPPLHLSPYLGRMDIALFTLPSSTTSTISR